MTPPLVLSIVALVVLVALFVAVARRAGRVISESREAEDFRQGVADLARRVDVSLAGIVERIDAVRRHLVPPDGIDENLKAALDALERYGGEAAGLVAPAPAGPLQRGIQDEIARAERALEMVEHGCRMLSAGSRSARDLEGETAIKRGYLNLLHAREAIATHALEVAETRGGLEPRWYSRRRSA